MNLIKNRKTLIIKKLFRTGFLHVFGASTFSNIVAFSSSIILVRLLTKMDYGVFSYAYNVYSLIAVFSGLGITSGILQLCSENYKNRQLSDKIYRYGCAFGFRFNIILSCFVLAFSFLYPLPVDGANYVLRLFSFFALFTLAYDLLTFKLRADMCNTTYSRASIINTILYFSFSVGFAFLSGSTGLVIGRYIAYMLSILFILKFFDVRLYFQFGILERKIKRTLFYISFISFLNNGLTLLFHVLEILLLGMVIQNGEVIASYKVATMIPTAMNFIPVAFITYAYPYFANHRFDKSWVYKNYIRSLLGLGVFNFIISLILIFMAPIIINIAFGKQYVDAIFPFQVLLVGYFIGGTFRVLAGNLLVTQRKLNFNLMVAVVGSILSIGANLFLIPSYGSNGAAYAHIIVVSITGIFNTVYMFYILKYSKEGEVNDA